MGEIFAFTPISQLGFSLQLKPLLAMGSRAAYTTKYGRAHEMKAERLVAELDSVFSLSGVGDVAPVSASRMEIRRRRSPLEL